MLFRIALVCLVSLAPLASASILCPGGIAESARPRSFEAYLAQESQFSGRRLPATRTDLPVLVIGAGPGGLGAMLGLAEQGIAFEGVERHTGVGGLWDISSPWSPAYRSLVTNSSRATTHLGERMPENWPAYLPHASARQYLVDLAERRGLTSRIRFRREVVRVQRGDDGAQHVEIRDLSTGATETRRYRAVVVANGIHSRQNAVYPQALWMQAIGARIRVLHAADYRDAESFVGQNVAVVGVGNFGAELATEISRVARNTYLAVRTTPWFVPLWVLGQPADEFAQGSPAWLPHWLEMFSFHVLQRYYVGHPSRFGFREPVRHGLLDRLPVSDRGIAQAIREGRIQVRSNLVAARNRRVYFESDRSEHVNTIVFATGFARRYPFLPPELTDGVEFPFHVFHPSDRGLYFMSEVQVPQGAWPLFVEQGRTVAADLLAQAEGRPEVARFDAIRAGMNPGFRGLIFSQEDDFHVDPHVYEGYLRRFRQWQRPGTN